MRSSVSYILSSTTSEPTMSHPDYEQYSHDHAALLVLVKHVGSQLKPKVYGKFFEQISKINNCKITDSTGLLRNIIVRYVREHPVENNDWGDFQTHRRLLGLISLGKYDSQQELSEICRVHESLKVKYNTTLFDSRCIFFGPPKEMTTPVSDDSSSCSENEVKKVDCVEIEKFTTPANFKTRALFYDEVGPCSDLETQVNEFVNSLFWVLESKRLERSREKLERVSLLLAPFEKKDFVGLDMESRNNKKRCTGRMTKHLGDLCLQAGLLNESLAYYTAAAETLKTINDWLWLGAAYEGLSTASALALYPEMPRNMPLHRNASLQEGSPRKSSVSVNAPLLSSPTKKIITNSLLPEDISKRYREAIIHYSKYQNAGIVETEASFKAARIAVEQNHALQAASFLQNVVYINLTLSEQEKIQRFETLAELYSQIGFNRKAAFCQRLAATRYVSPQNTSPNWGKCYSLMLQSLPGHCLTLDPVEMKETDQGWPALQIQLLQELVVAARRTGNSALATRHMTFLLQTMWGHLTPTEQKELSIQLQSLSAQCEGSPVLLVLDSGIVVPPANLTDIPMCTAFIVRDLQPHLRPKAIPTLVEDPGPFLFTPRHFGGGNSLDRRQQRAKTKVDFLWVENEVCEIQVKLVNPLPFELKVSNMRLLTSGVVFESVPETVVLPPDVSTTLTLSGWAREGGELELSGYSTHTLGVKSNCKLKHMASTNFPNFYKVDVVPALPQLKVTTSFPPSASFSNFHDDNIVTSAGVTLFHGESTQCTVTLTNIGQVDVEMLEAEIHSVLEPSLQDQIFSWDDSEVQSQLPIKPGTSATLTLRLHSAANFLAPNVTASPSTLPHDLSSGVYSSMSASVTGGSLPSRFNSSFRSTNSAMSSLVGLPTVIQQHTSSAIEGQLRLRYSGGPGFKSDYCRMCSVFIMIEMIPSLHVTNWDVLPAEISSQFYLVLDIANLTSQEMELRYTPTKTMLIEGQESCRVPVPVDRCPLSKLSKYYEDTEDDNGSTNVDMTRICSEHISELVDLQWLLLATDSKGTSSLKGITLTSRMMDIVRMSPLMWEVQVNGSAIRPQEDINCDAGDCLELKMNLTNSLDKALKQLNVSVQFYQDYENGNLNYRLDTRLATTGSVKKTINCLQSKEIASHECNVIFFTPGQYKVDIQCCAPDNFSTMCASTLSTGHVWRFTPPINISVK
ncbi:unnamed protein product [Brassicogethes aeneus]|uniref:Protein brunelleschi n=1 Tax=Brassicogethes aeneus TaxID=1431903 RepID=A0A9P0BH33_BRAAE|nr:unnamed protein product [Brassicogethes aeneus]